MKRTIWALALATTLMAVPAHAQLNGDNLLGDTGVRNGTQPDPGLYLGVLYFHYFADTIKNADGTTLTLAPSQPASQHFGGFAPLMIYVSRAKVLGANFGAMAAPAFANGNIEAPAFGFQLSLTTGVADSYFMPLQLGWHLPRADVTTGFAFFAPTGRYQAFALDNLGKGMWAFELSGGSTVYFDPDKTISASTTAFWETHTAKQGTGVTVGPTTLTGVKVGQILTLEGGAAKSFKQGAVSFGAAYYAQWKLTDDQFGFAGTPPGGPLLGKHRVFGIGPDVTLPVATKSVLVALVNLRYQWELGARAKTQGQTLNVTATFPVPSIKVQ